MSMDVTMQPGTLKGIVHPRLVGLLTWVTTELGTQEVTSLWRDDPTSVHGQIPVRGVDLRCRSKLVAYAIAKHVNDNWEYDPARPGKKVAIAHDVGFGMHLHLQVSDATRWRRG